MGDIRTGSVETHMNVTIYTYCVSRTGEGACPRGPWSLDWSVFYWRASVASETLTGVTQSKIGDVCLFIQRASEASEADYQSCSIEISDIYIYYSFDTGEYHESVGLVFMRVPQARA